MPPIPAPGVHFETAPAAPAPTLRTGVPAFLGWGVAPGSVTPLPVRRWDDAGATGPMAAAVRGFFANGGEECVVVGLAPAVDPSVALHAGLDALEGFDDVDLICLPDVTAHAEEIITLQQLALHHCAQRGDRFAVLDALPGATLDGVAEQRRRLSKPAGGYGALYHPWLRTPAARDAPPCGHVAGLYARSDREVGVHKAPANVPVEDVVDLQTPLGTDEVGTLYGKGVNCVRVLPGRGVRVWGARTIGNLSVDTAWPGIAERRLVITVGRWIERFLQYIVHEPNQPLLWVRIRRELTAYLDGLFTAGALRGATPAEAFFVTCDSTTNTAEVIAAGRVETRIGLALTKPAEFIHVHIRHDADGVTATTA